MSLSSMCHPCRGLLFMFEQFPHSFRCGLLCVVPPGLSGTGYLSTAGNGRNFTSDFSTMSDCKSALKRRGEPRGGRDGGGRAISAQADDGRHPGGGGAAEELGPVGRCRRNWHAQ